MAVKKGCLKGMSVLSFHKLSVWWSRREKMFIPSGSSYRTQCCIQKNEKFSPLAFRPPSPTWILEFKTEIRQECNTERIYNSASRLQSSSEMYTRWKMTLDVKISSNLWIIVGSLNHKLCHKKGSRGCHVLKEENCPEVHFLENWAVQMLRGYN